MNECKKDEEFPQDDRDLLKYTKEELVRKIKSVVAHNTQLKSIIAKQSQSAKTNNKQTRSFNFSKYNVQHIALKILYLGWKYNGFVVQEDTTETIEHHLFEALMKTKLIKDRASSNYHRCGRTDKGVSSLGQVISIDVRSSLKGNDSNDKEIDYCKILNRVLPNNIQCLAWSPVDKNFSARFDCISRTYRYYFPKGNLNIDRIKIASQKLLGSHDFRNFCKMDVGNGVVEFVRNIYEINVGPLENGRDENAIFVIQIKAKAFLWHQIRCIMGLLLLIGQEKEDPSIVDELLDVEKNPRKPDYGMASEIPLNLFFCEYNDLSWNYEEEALQRLIEQLSSIWTITAIKQSMIKDMLTSIKNESGYRQADTCLSNVLLQGVKARTYIPVMKRPTCNSLDEKIKHFGKRKKKLKIG